MKAINKDNFTYLSSEENVSVYKWNKKIASHFFCKVCGVYTHHIRRRDPSQISINLMCVDNLIIPQDIKVDIIDGANHD